VLLNRYFHRILKIYLFILVVGLLHAQENTPANTNQNSRSSTAADSSNETFSAANYLRNIVLDQRSFWTFPARLQRKDAKAVLPFVAFTAGLLASDASFSSQLSRSSSRINTSNNISNFGLAAMIAGGGGAYLYGRLGRDEHARETGILSSEAAIDAAIISEGLKLLTERQRPNEGSGQGHFWTGGGFNSSFPSQHAAVAWSLAAVFAHEYPSPAMKLLSYGAASAISVSRITSLNHFPSDVFVGSTIGYLVGREVYGRHHNDDLPGASYGTFVKADDGQRSPFLTGTTFVPMDSWVYPLIDRLAARGYIDSGFEGNRPWTRQNCARLVKEAGQQIQAQTEVSDSTYEAYKELQNEFAPELNETINTDLDARLESSYVSVLGITGPPLTDGFDFGQTIINNFGRPYGEGVSNTVGFSTRFVAGPFGAYIRGEYEHGAAPMSLSPAVQDAILRYEAPAAPPGSPWFVPPATTVNQFHFLDAYLSLNLRNNLFTFGKQSLWWGPSQAGPFLFSTNAQPIPMFRYSRNVPFVIPVVSKILGPMQVELFLGQLNGYQYVTYFQPNGEPIAVPPPIHPHPWIHGERISFKPTPNFEFGVGETTIFGGPGFGFNGHTFLRSYSISNTIPGQNDDPGDRRSGFDFSYRIPGLRNWLTFYADSFTEDEFSPIAYPRRSAWWMGFYLPRLPKLHNLDFRAEGGYTDLPGLVGGSGHFYGNGHYNSGYTNYGQLMGNWVGQQGRGIQALSTYWFSARNKVQLSFRKQAANPSDLGGGTLYDGGGTATFTVTPNLELSGHVQYERWRFPILSTGTQSNVSISVQLDFLPLGGITASKLVHFVRW
jgi:Capsule assembly protein Wzi/PAP2 superfamily